MSLPRNFLLSSALILALAACGSDDPVAPQAPVAQQAPSQSTEHQGQSQSSDSDTEITSPGNQSLPEETPSQEQVSPGELVGLVYSRFKENFPQVADFRTDPVISRIEPVSGVELFEIVSPNGIFYTDRHAQWILEGVLFMPDPSEASTSAQTGLPSNMINITLRPDVQRWYGERRDREAASQTMGQERISGSEFFQSMPREKAVVLDYGTPTPEREIVMIVDIDDQATHDLFHALEQLDGSGLNFRILAFPVGIEEIRPHTLPRSSALLCAGFDPANPAENSETVSRIWRKFLSSPATANMPEQEWLAWAQSNSIAPQAHDACPRQIEPGVFTRLVATLGLSGTPRAVFANGSDLLGDFTPAQMLEKLNHPQDDGSTEG